MAKARLAGKAFNLLEYLTKGLRNADGALDMGQVGMRVVPDAVLGGLTALQTPGDLGDKVIAGTSDVLGGTLGGLALGGLTSNPLGSLALDTVGSLGGGQLGYMAGDALMRAKDKLSGGKGQTPYERLGEKEQRIMAERMRRQILTEYGLGNYVGMG